MPIHQTDRYWILETASSAYAFGITPDGFLAHTYWGTRLMEGGDYPSVADAPGWASFNGAGQLVPEEYPAFGGYKFIEPCLKLTFADGVRDVALRVDGAGVEGERIIVRLYDAHYPLRVELHYRLHVQQDVIERYAVLFNEGDTPITIERAFSTQWHLPAGDNYRLTHLTGRWFDEMHVRREPLVQGVKVLESRRGLSGHHHNPWFAADTGSADEDGGAVWFGTLAWSGNWKLTAEVTDFASTRVSIGINDWDFAYPLPPHAAFSTPSSYAGFAREGFGGASRRLHDVIRTLLPHPGEPRRVLYNSWEATMFNVDVESQAALAERAAAIGVELFVMDDGWFHGRSDDTAGLGDWFPDAKKFPDGLQPLIERVNALGMDFGLWVEPEMVNANSDLYRAHPDWVLRFPTRPPTEARNQMVLNLARADVQDYLIDVLDKLLAAHNITFVKWDANRNFSEPGSPDGQAVWFTYVQGLYRVLEALRQRHPRVVFQSCSGGGGRADVGMLRYADQIWVSDNTEAVARLSIQEGFSYAFPPDTMEAWVTDMNPSALPLDFRFHASMCGVLGIGGSLTHWSERDLKRAAHWIDYYKRIRHVVQFGDLFRLRAAQQHAYSAVQYVTKDKAESVLFVFRTLLPHPTILPPVYLRGLDPQARYEIEGLGVRSGAGWMHAGVQVELDNFRSAVYHIKRL